MLKSHPSPHPASRHMLPHCPIPLREVGGRSPGAPREAPVSHMPHPDTRREVPWALCAL